MYFSSNVFENNSMTDKNTEQMLGYQNDYSKINPLNEINQNTYQSKSDTKIRKKITFNKMKNSINAVCKEYNEKKSIINKILIILIKTMHQINLIIILLQVKKILLKIILNY